MSRRKNRRKSSWMRSWMSRGEEQEGEQLGEEDKRAGEKEKKDAAYRQGVGPTSS